MKQKLDMIRIYYNPDEGICSGCGTSLNPENESIENGGQCKDCGDSD